MWTLLINIIFRITYLLQHYLYKEWFISKSTFDYIKECTCCSEAIIFTSFELFPVFSWTLCNQKRLIRQDFHFISLINITSWNSILWHFDKCVGAQNVPVVIDVFLAVAIFNLIIVILLLLLFVLLLQVLLSYLIMFHFCSTVLV